MSRPPSLDMLRPRVEEELKRRVGKLRLPLYDMLRYHMGWIDDMRAQQPLATPDRVFGTLSLLSAEAANSTLSGAVLPAAAAAEIFAAFADVQDDLRTGTPNRDNRPALWWVFGHSQGINAADGMYSLARMAIIDCSKQNVPYERVLEALRVMDDSCLSICESRSTIMGLRQKDRLTVDAYLGGIESEWGSVASVALTTGGILTGAGPALARILQDGGKKLGTAWRIRRELNLFSQESFGIGSQVLEALDKGGSLLLLHAREQGNSPTRTLLDDLAGRKEPVEDKHLRQLVDALEASGTFDFARGAIDLRLDEALLLLAQAFPDGKDAPLASLARYLAGGDQD